MGSGMIGSQEISPPVDKKLIHILGYSEKVEIMEILIEIGDWLGLLWGTRKTMGSGMVGFYMINKIRSFPGIKSASWQKFIHILGYSEMVEIMEMLIRDYIMIFSLFEFINKFVLQCD